MATTRLFARGVLQGLGMIDQATEPGPWEIVVDGAIRLLIYEVGEAGILILAPLGVITPGDMVAPMKLLRENSYDSQALPFRIGLDGGGVANLWVSFKEGEYSTRDGLTLLDAMSAQVARIGAAFADVQPELAET
jgi:hypothetical protein